MAETLQLRGTLEGHSGWVTQIATNPKYPDIILSASRDKTLIVWKLTRDEQNYGVPQKRLHGHGHFVSDVVLSSDGHFALSGSWDKNLRLWDLSAGRSTRRFEDHSHDVLSVAFSADNRQIVSGSRDKTIKLWNTLAQCKYTIQEEGHTEWVSCVRFSPNNQNPHHCFLRLGQICQGLELGQLQAQDQPHWTHRILEHRNHVSRRFFVCLRWQGCQSNVVGSQ